ncbi:MAG: hypothetical protein HC837_10360 [Chloroflexaceae bacterium]|nr:hypothetical protein [Chloroflexaceae bacterium]
MAINREQIRNALAETDINYSYYLDLESGNVERVHDTDPGDDTLRNQIFEGYGDRYRYIPGGNPDADAAAVQTWLEAEGLA